MRRKSQIVGRGRDPRQALEQHHPPQVRVGVKPLQGRGDEPRHGIPEPRRAGEQMAESGAPPVGPQPAVAGDPRARGRVLVEIQRVSQRVAHPVACGRGQEPAGFPVDDAADDAVCLEDVSRP